MLAQTGAGWLCRQSADKLKKYGDDVNIDLRQKLFAHTDLVYKNPKIANWSNEQKKWFPMSFKGFDYDQLDSKVKDIKELIEYVQNELRQQINRFEEDL
jgi:hypothetical protein